MHARISPNQGGQGDTIPKGYDSQSENLRTGPDDSFVGEEELSTVALIRGSSQMLVESSSVCGEVDMEGESWHAWGRPWTHEEMEPLAITMQDFEVRCPLSLHDIINCLGCFTPV